jgi:AcrR family transcriptional regulator
MRVGGILEAARDVFCRKGYEQAAVAEIAARLGVLERWYEEMFGDYARDLAGVRDPRERLRLLVWRHLRSVRENPQLCRLMFREVRSGPDYPGSPLHAQNRRYTQLLMDVVAQGAAARAFRDDVPLPLLRDLVYGGIEHHTWNFMSGRGGLDIERIAADITSVLCDGIAVPRRKRA